MKTVLITGATDGIGLETAKRFAAHNWRLLLHGRNREKLLTVQKKLKSINDNVEIFLADFSNLSAVASLAEEILTKCEKLDVLINNAGVFVTENSRTIAGLDVRFAVNTIAPYILTKKLLPILAPQSRVINLTSAAQAPVDWAALRGEYDLSADAAYAQSKLALIMWTMDMAEKYPIGPIFIAVNPKSFLGSKMVKKAYGRNGYDLAIGADVLYRAATSAEFDSASGLYFDNDYGSFSEPRYFALEPYNRAMLIDILNSFFC